MNAKIAVLRPHDHVCQNSEPIATMYRDMGRAAAEQVVNRALGEIALTMSDLAHKVRAHDLTDLGRHLRRLQRMSAHLGLVSLGAAADHVQTCLANDDSTAFSAVWARLIRVAERSLEPSKDRLDRTV